MFVVEPYLEGKRRFHSLSCFNKWKKGKGINAGPKNVNWKGGISSTGNGYLKVTAGKHSGKLHHRYVMEQFLGHPIPCGFVVHHKDGNKKNNDIKNLQLMTNAEHINHHRNELLKWRRG